jgi:hypothetical protein
LEDEIARLRQEILQLEAQLPVLEGLPDAQQHVRGAISQRRQHLAHLLGYAVKRTSANAISLTASASTLHIWDEGRLRSFPSSLSDTALIDLLGSLRNDLLAIASTFRSSYYRKHVIGTPEVCAAALRHLARHGHYLWQALFRDPALNRWAVALRERGRTAPLQLNLVTPGLVLPWQLVYDRDPDEDVELDGFWGLRHWLTVSARQGLPDYVVPDDSTLTALAGFYLAFAEDAEIRDPEIVNRQQSLVRRLVPLADMITSDAELLARLRAGSDARVLYLFSHVDNLTPAFTSPFQASDRTIGTAGTRIILTKEGGLSLVDLRNAAPLECAPRLRGHPLVILNACGSATQSPVHDFGLVSFFFDHGAQALIGTECKIPVIFGDVFGAALLEALTMPGQSFGSAIRTTRRLLIERDHNPLGMLYALLGRADMCLVPAS